MIAWIVCTALVSGCSLAGWILWIRIQPRVSREEFLKHQEDVKALMGKVAKAQQALQLRGMWT